MATQTKLQIPLSSHLKKLLKLRIESLGFTSMNEAIRVLLKRFAEGDVDLFANSMPTYMVSEETEKRIGESIADYERGDYIVVDPDDDEALEKALSQ
jgi:type III secretory pathway component EscV